jgi:hypothetical protein
MPPGRKVCGEVVDRNTGRESNRVSGGLRGGASRQTRFSAGRIVPMKGATPLLPMKAVDPIVFLELHIIQKIIDDEIWLEGERRGCAVDPNDPVVIASVCEIVLRIGAELRARTQARLKGRRQSMHEDNAMAA